MSPTEIKADDVVTFIDYAIDTFFVIIVQMAILLGDVLSTSYSVRKISLVYNVKGTELDADFANVAALSQVLVSLKYSSIAERELLVDRQMDVVDNGKLNHLFQLLLASNHDASHNSSTS